jgi:pimeloyl-ACP methyl ester carboxylesterase
MPHVISKDGLKIHYGCENMDSKKVPLVFVHGFLVNWTCFKNEIEYFKKEGHPIIYFDLRGHGKSDTPDSYKEFSFQHMTDDLESVLNHLKLKRKIVLIGHSLGGMVSTSYAIHNPEKIARLIVIDSANRYPDKKKLLTKFAGKHILKGFYEHYLKNKKKYKTKKIDVDVNKIDKHSNPEIFFFKRLFKSDMSTVFYISDMVFNMKLDKINRITCPTMIIGSSKDELFSEDEEINFGNDLSKSIVKFFPGGHNIIMKQPNVISQEVKQFLHTSDSYFAK